MKAKKTIIELTNITKEYFLGDITARILQGISLTVYTGEFLAITGPSGSGKSTLMNIIGLLDTATNGTYILNGQDVTRLTEDQQAFSRNKEIGFVFQSFNLLRRSSALENVILPAIYAGVSERERTKRAIELLSLVGLSEHIHKNPNQLSGGQQQRVAIARALMNDPSIILADEPTGNLDSKSGDDVIRIIRDLHKQGRTIIMITHSPDIAKEAQKIIHIRDGSIV